MKKENTAIRLKKIMEARGLRQVDILNLALPFCEKYNVKMNKSDLSQYCSGKTEPNQDKLFVLGAALSVDETWLMGYDVPMERYTRENPNIVRFDSKLDEALNILTRAGYEVLFSEYPIRGIITIKDVTGKTLSSMYDYEIVGKYESLQKKNEVLAEQLLNDPKQIFLLYLNFLGYRLIQDTPEHTPFIHTDSYTCRLENDTLDKMRARIEKYFRAIIDSELLALHEEEVKQERLENERIIRFLTKETSISKARCQNSPPPDKALEEQSCTIQTHFVDKHEASKYLKSRSLAAFKNNESKLSDQDIINLANNIWGQKT